MSGRSANPQPFDFDQARAAAHQASRSQKEAEEFRRQATTNLAETERRYRVALAKKILEVHSEGIAWTVAQDVSRGDKQVAELRYQRDVAKGVVDAAEQAVWRHAADRKDLGRFVDWSMRVAPDGQRDPTRAEERALA